MFKRKCSIYISIKHMFFMLYGFIFWSMSLTNFMLVVSYSPLSIVHYGTALHTELPFRNKCTVKDKGPVKKL